jgi:DNA polymerase I
VEKKEAINQAKLLKDLIELNKVSKILSTFIPTFKNKSIPKADGTYYLHGSFNLGGTLSGRLSSSNP